jgi:hypothetical protein
MKDIYLTPEVNNPVLETPDSIVRVTPLIRVNYDRGIFAYYEGAEYPQKGMTPVEVMRSINIVKAIVSGVLSFRFNLLSLLMAFNRIGNKAIEQYLLKDEYRTAGTLELCRIVYDFIFSLTSNDTVALHFSRIFSHLIEYDNAYRLRFLDLGSETTKEKLLKNPRKEMKRLVKLLTEREVFLGKDVSDKFNKVVSILSWLLFIPKYRKAFKYAIHMADWEKMTFDNTDRYWACLRTDYDFFGLSYDERMKMIKDNGYSIPVQKEIKI